MGVKTAGVGHFQIPTAPAAGTSVTSGAANVYTTTYVQLIASTAAALYITGIFVESAAVHAWTYCSVQLATGTAGSEAIIGQYLIALETQSTSAMTYRPIFPPIPVANATRIAVKTADSVGAIACLVSLECLAATNYVDDGVAVGTVTTVTNQLTAAAIATGVWQDATAGDFTTASSIGKSLYIANVAPGASGGHFIAGSNAGTTTFGALTVTGATTLTGNAVLSDGLTISAPSTLNRAGITITGNGTGAAISGTGGATGQGLLIAGGGTSGDGIKVTTTSGHGVNLAPVGTNMHGLLSTGGNGGTSDGIKAAAGTGGVDIRGNITGNLVGTVSTLTTYTGNTVQTGDSFARIGAAGASLTALGDTRIANLDAAVSTRMATYTQPTGFLAATFPSGTVANTTNITAGTMTTVTTVTNQLTAAQIATGIWQDTVAGDFTTALSVGKSVMNGVALGTGLTVASVSGAVGSVTGAVGSVTGAVGSVTGNVGGSVASVTAGVTVATNNDKTGYGLSAAAVQAIWDALTSALTTVGSIGKLIVTNLDALISSRMASYTQPTGFLAATFPTTVASTSNITSGTITTVTNLTNAPTAGDLTATMKASVTTAATAATPTAAAVTGAVGSVTGLTASNLDATVSSRLASASYTAPPSANTVADALLDRTDAIETGVTPRGMWRLVGAVLAGTVSGAGTTTNTFRNAVADSKSRVTATVDSSGNRTAITTDQT